MLLESDIEKYRNEEKKELSFEHKDIRFLLYSHQVLVAVDLKLETSKWSRWIPIWELDKLVTGDNRNSALYYNDLVNVGGLFERLEQNLNDAAGGS